MKRLFITGATSTAMLMVLSSSWAAINLNSSKSNIYQLVYDANVVSQAQGDALAKGLDKRGALTEAEAKKWLAANFKTFGIDGARVKVIRVLLQQGITCGAAETCKGKYVGSEQQAAKTSSVKSSKSNTSDRSSGVCFCYEPITSATQIAKVNKASTIIRILLLTELDQEAMALSVRGTDPPPGQ